MKTLTSISWLLAILTLLLLPTSCSQSTEDPLTDGPQPGEPIPGAPLVTVHVAEAGTFTQRLSNPYETINLKVTGKLNGTDLRYIRELAGRDIYNKPTAGALKYIDLSEAVIINGGETYLNTNVAYAPNPDINNISNSLPGLFLDCENLISVKMPNHIRELRGTFMGCSSLTSVSLPEWATNLEFTFRDCEKLSSVKIPDGVTNLSCTFYGCTSLTSVNIPGSVTNLSRAFEGCTSLTTIDLPKSVRNLNDTFKGCTSLTTIDLPESVEFLDGTFKGCTSLTSIDLPESVSSLNGTFKGCTSLTTIDLPESVIFLDCTFYGCTSLTSVNMLGDNALYLGNTFKDCPNLRTIRLFSPIPPIPREFPELSDNVTIYVPKGSYMSYRETGWGDYNLMEFDAVGIDTPVQTNKAGVPEYYSIEGKLLTSPQRRVSSVREANGTTKKVFIQRP